MKYILILVALLNHTACKSQLLRENKFSFADSSLEFIAKFSSNVNYDTFKLLSVNQFFRIDTLNAKEIHDYLNSNNSYFLHEDNSNDDYKQRELSRIIRALISSAKYKNIQDSVVIMILMENITTIEKANLALDYESILLEEKLKNINLDCKIKLANQLLKSNRYNKKIILKFCKSFKNIDDFNIFCVEFIPKLRDFNSVYTSVVYLFFSQNENLYKYSDFLEKELTALKQENFYLLEKDLIKIEEELKNRRLHKSRL